MSERTKVCFLSCYFKPFHDVRAKYCNYFTFNWRMYTIKSVDKWQREGQENTRICIFVFSSSLCRVLVNVLVIKNKYPKTEFQRDRNRKSWKDRFDIKERRGTQRGRDGERETQTDAET